MAKSPKEPDDQKPKPSEDEVLRRMLNTPPKPHKGPVKNKKGGPRGQQGPRKS